MRKGIVGGGNLIMDKIKIIDYYPEKNMMCSIIQEPQTAIGGCPHNVLVNLSKMEVGIPLYALGLVGNDYEGGLIFQDFEENGINTEFIQRTSTSKTSFTDAMIEKSTGNRTFFHYGGANSELDYEHFLEAGMGLDAKIFHLANLLHLEKLDSEDPEYGLISAKVLKFLLEQGFKTSVDLVSVKNSFSLIRKYCLKYIDYLIFNEIEAESLSEVQIRTFNGINKDNLVKAGSFLIQNGIREFVFIHFPEGGFAIDKNLKTYFSESFWVESSEIVSAVGAGDAFCSGILYSLHEELPIEEALKIANACARFNLFDETTTGGAQNIIKIKEFISNSSIYKMEG